MRLASASPSTLAVLVQSDGCRCACDGRSDGVWLAFRGHDVSCHDILPQGPSREAGAARLAATGRGGHGEQGGCKCASARAPRPGEIATLP